MQDKHKTAISVCGTTTLTTNVCETHKYQVTTACSTIGRGENLINNNFTNEQTLNEVTVTGHGYINSL